MKTLAEWIEVQNSGEEGLESNKAAPHTELLFDNMLAVWGRIAYAELSIILVQLRYLAMIHQTHHWIAKGDSFYGDHKLFGDLYDAVVDEVDTVAEKSVGKGSEYNVNLQLQVLQLQELSKAVSSPQTVPQTSDLAKASLVAECNFLKIIDAAWESMQSNGTATSGIENMLQGIADKHEKHVYLLKRRTSSAALGL